MSKRNKGNKVQTQQSTEVQTNETQTEAITATTTAGEEAQVATNNDLAVQQSETVTEQPAAISSEPTIVVGSVVAGTSSALGNKVDEQKTKEIISQKPIAQPQDVSKFEKRVNEIKAKGNTLQKLIVNVFEKYVVDMAPGKPVEEKNLHRSQMQLWNVLKNTLENEDGFEDNWKLVISFFREYKDGALGKSYPYRGLDNITVISAEQNQALMNLLNLLTISGGIVDKKSVQKYVRLDKAIHRIFSEEVRQRVVNYYV